MIEFVITRRSAMKLAGATGLALTRSAGGGSDVLVLVEKGSHALSFYEVDTGRRLHTVTLAAYPHELVVDAERRFAYVGHYGVRPSC
ncbi:MAG: hypothetical protein ACRDRP_06200 [Pseudonocardiaceae bacterium]